jgi:glutamyl-tRNA reductase
MVVALAGAGVSDVRIANRTPERAEALATRVGGSVLGLSEVPGALADVDLLLTSTGAHSLLLEQADLEPLLEARADRPLLIVDIAVPRDVDSSIGLLPGVTLLDMDDLRRFAEVGLKRRRGEVVAVQGIVNDELERFDAACSARAVAPLVATLRERAEQVRLDEVDRFASRLDGLDDRQREAVEALTRGILGKLLHGPTVKLKDLAGTARGERLADALRDLYDLELD